MTIKTTVTSLEDQGHEQPKSPALDGSRLRQLCFSRASLLFFIITSIFLTPAMNKASAVELSPHLYKTTLDNGLTLLVRESPATRVATVQIWVKAGSVYEEPDEGGITHLIEHMIFKGTPSRKAGEVAGAIEEAGGSINAYTSFEYTVYHATLSARNWELALEVISDAVLNSTFDPDELEREKKVVLEEIAMREDRPQTRLFQELMTRSYQVHPYRLPVIGTRESVSSFSRDDIITYVQKHYHPDNLTVVIAGDVRFRDVEERVKELMGSVPREMTPPPKLPQEPARQKADFFSLSGDIQQTHLALAFPITPFDHPDSPVLDVIAGLLGQGETSRLYNRLRNKEGLVYQISAGAFTPRDAGLFEIFATMDNSKAKQVLEAALEETFKLKHVQVKEDELARIKRSLESDFVFGMEMVEGQARIIGSFELQAGDPREDEYLSRIRSVTREDIIRVASSYFDPKKMTIGIISPENNQTDLNLQEVEKIAERADNLARHGVPSALERDAYLSNVYHYKLPNGLRLLVREDPRVETIAIRAVFPGGLRSETDATNGAFAFISELLPKGTTDLTYRQLAIKIADMAGNISGFNGKNTFGLKADFLARFFEPGLQLVHDVIRKPAFDQKEAEKIRPELLAQLMHQEDSLPTVTFLNFNKALFQSHPYGLNTAGHEESLRSLTVDQLRDLYNSHARPEKMILAVAGAVKAEEVRQMVEQIFGDWHVESEPTRDLGFEEESILPPDQPARPDFVKIVKEREQLHLLIGFLGTTMTDPDRYALEILDTILNGQSGRLFVSLRDKQSLAYSLSSFSLFGIDTGAFGIYVGTSPDKKNQAIQAVWKELFKTRQELVSEAELAKARNLLIGQYEMSLQTHSAQAMEMALNETYGLGQDYGNKYIKALEEVTSQQVLEVARKYILPDHYIMVTVGAEPSTETDKKEPAAKSAAKPTEEEAGESEPEKIDLPGSSEDNKDTGVVQEEMETETDSEPVETTDPEANNNEGDNIPPEKE